MRSYPQTYVFHLVDEGPGIGEKETRMFGLWVLGYSLAGSFSFPVSASFPSGPSDTSQVG